MPNYTTYNIKMVKGDTESFGFEIEGIDNLDAAYFSCKQNSQDEQYLFQKTLGGGITQSSENLYVVRIAPGDTILLNPGQYWYDLEIRKNNDVFTIFRGVMDLLPEITAPSGSVKPDAIWGRIVGEIENQTDLQAEFNTKANISSLSAVATSGSYTDLTNKPNLAAVAISGSYNDLSNTPNLATVATTGAYSDLTGTPNLAAVATSGSYNDLSNKPTIPTKTSDLTNDSNFVASTSLATVATTGAYSDLTGTPNLAAVATSGSYNDLSNTPNLAAVATSGSYTDLSNTPNLSTVATSGLYSDLTGKPNLATVATSGSYNDLSNTPNLATVAISGLATDLTGVLPLTNGGTGATNASDARENLGLTRQVAYESSNGSDTVNIDYTAPGTTLKIGVLYCLFNVSANYEVHRFYNEFSPKKEAGTLGYDLPVVGLSSLAQQSSSPYMYFNGVHFTITYHFDTDDFKFGYITGKYPSFKIFMENDAIKGAKDANYIAKIYKIIVYSY